jgi:NTP pyrophosphatase (non-canonical NTP hydrolase)
MDPHTTVQSLKDRARAFCAARDWERFHTPKELAIGVTTEAAELLAAFRFKSDAEARAIAADPAKRRELSGELADTLYFLLRLSEVLEIDLSTAFEEKLRINEQRYPVEKSRGKNLKYNEL